MRKRKETGSPKDSSGDAVSEAVCTCRVLRERGKRALKAKPSAILDISTTSARIAVNQQLKEHTRVELCVTGGGFSEPATVRGSVSWCRRDGEHSFTYEAAVDLSPPAGEDMQRLRQMPQFFDLRRIQIDRDLVEALPRGIAQELKTVPFRFDEETGAVHLATSTWHGRDVLDNLRNQFGHDIELHYAPVRDVVRAVRFLYGTMSVQAAGASTGSAFLANMLEEADRLRASDIHLQPGDPCLIRYRVDGVMTAGPSLERDQYRGLVNRIKVEAGMDITEQRDAQDGHFEWQTPEKQHRDVRVAAVPTVLGEHLSMRLLGPGDRPGVLTELGLSDDQLGLLADGLSQPEGLILLAGPTGAGKTTTLYAMLRDIDRGDRHVLTIEDPAEHKFANVTQIELHGHTKLAASNILRSVMRHDPDVLTIGEIRDEETLHIAMQSALSGALTLAGMQADDAPSAPVRLLHMGAPPYVLASNLRLVIAQRLMRRLCKHCCRKVELGEDEAHWLGLEPGAPAYEPGACGACDYTGYRGRIGAFEVLPIGPGGRRLIMGGASAEEFRQAALDAGLVSMLARAASYVESGVTDAKEALHSIPLQTAGREKASGF
jgi:type II secretory ATPase GspE/PulE/Tfp pilus assembly ATPase PilB-like protein